MKSSNQKLIPIVDIIKDRKFNDFSDDLWQFVTRTGSQPFSIDLSPSYRNISSYSIFWLKTNIRLDFDSLSDGRLLANEHEIKKFLITYLKIIEFSESQHLGIRFAKWNQIEIERLVEFLLYSKSKSSSITKRANGSRLVSKKVFEIYVSAINNIYYKSVRGLIDGFSTHLHPSRSLSIAKDVIDNNGDDYGSWISGGTWGRVPVELSMLLLHHCLTVIRSKRTVILRTMYTAGRNGPQSIYPPAVITRITPELTFRAINRRLKNDLERHPHSTAHLKYPELLHAADTQLCAFESQADNLKCWPFQTQASYVDQLKEVYTACFIIFLTVTGARWSELRQLKSDSIYKNDQGNYKFISPIEKTNFGIETVRDITGLAAEATDVLLDLSKSDKGLVGQCLFECEMLFSKKNLEPRYWSLTDIHGTTVDALNVFFKNFLGVYQEFNGLHTHITPHQFRHSFAEFALRRFDGNVFMALRNHFRHSFGSYMTHRYTDRKIIEKDEPVNLDREYIGELIMRYVDNNEMFHGPVGKFIRDQVDELKIRSIDDAQELIDQFDDSLEAHEYGFCIIRSETRTLSKCWNPKTGLPEVKNANFQLCSGCANRLSLDNQKEDIERLGFSSKGHLDYFDEIGVVLNDQYRSELNSVIKNATSILSEWEK